MGPCSVERQNLLVSYAWSEEKRQTMVRDALGVSRTGVAIDVCEIFSRPRLCPVASRTGLHIGGSYDIVTGFDLILKETQKKVLARIVEADVKVALAPSCDECQLNSARSSLPL